MSLCKNPYVLGLVVFNAFLAYWFLGWLSLRNPAQRGGGVGSPTTSTTSQTPPPLRYRDYTLEELLPFNGKDQPNILIAIDQRIFDVSSAPHYYGPGSAYGTLAGRDASRALASHTIPTFNGKKLQSWDDLTDLNIGERESLNEWVSFFDSKYPRVGTLVQVHAWAGSGQEDEVEEGGEGGKGDKPKVTRGAILDDIKLD